jgi:hypothetical protein
MNRKNKQQARIFADFILIPSGDRTSPMQKNEAARFRVPGEDTAKPLSLFDTEGRQAARGKLPPVRTLDNS